VIARTLKNFLQHCHQRLNILYIIILLNNYFDSTKLFSNLYLAKFSDFKSFFRKKSQRDMIEKSKLLID